MTRTEQLQARYARVMMPNYGLPPVALAYGRGQPGLGRRRAAVHRPDRGHRRQRARPRSPGADRGGQPPGEPARARLQPVPARAPGAAGRAAARPARRPGRQGVPGQLGHRGQRGRGQGGPPGPAGQQPPGHRRRRGRLPRPVLGVARDDRQGLDPGAVRAVRLAGAVRAVRRRGGVAGRGQGRHRSGVPRARSGRGRCGPAPARLPAGRQGSVRRGRRAARAGRDPERPRAAPATGSRTSSTASPRT